jgi:hypothetical protein
LRRSVGLAPADSASKREIQMRLLSLSGSDQDWRGTLITWLAVVAGVVICAVASLLV